MAHDRQVKQTNDENEGKKSAKTSLEVLREWWALSIQVWKDDPTHELALVYRETLKDIQPWVLHRAFLRVARTCKFRPTPAEIREAADVEAELMRKGNRPKYLDEPPLSQAEREAAMEETKELREELRRKLQVVAQRKSA